jgi:hypothetical protein
LDSSAILRLWVRQSESRTDGWFDAHAWAYQSEARAIKMLVPHDGAGVERGAGKGHGDGLIVAISAQHDNFCALIFKNDFFSPESNK